MRLLVVTHSDMPTAALEPLLATIYEGPFAHEMQPPDLLEVGSEYPLHLAASRYLDRRRPLTAKDVTLALQGILSVLGACSAGGLALFGYVRRRRGRQPAAYLQELHAIERRALGLEGDAQATDEPGLLAAELDRQLNELRHRLLADWAGGQLSHEALLTNLLALMADTRQTLTRLRETRKVKGTPGVTVRRRNPASADSTAPSLQVFQQAE